MDRSRFLCLMYVYRFYAPLLYPYMYMPVSLVSCEHPLLSLLRALLSTRRFTLQQTPTSPTPTITTLQAILIARCPGYPGVLVPRDLISHRELLQALLRPTRSSLSKDRSEGSSVPCCCSSRICQPCLASAFTFTPPSPH